LAEEKPGQCAGKNFGALKFRGPGAGAAIFHRSAGVAHDVEAYVRLQHVALDAEPIATSVEPPIEVAEVVAGLIIAIVAEFDAETMKWTVVEAAEKTFHDVTRLEVEPFQSGEEFRLETGGKGFSSGGHD